MPLGRKTQVQKSDVRLLLCSHKYKAIHFRGEEREHLKPTVRAIRESTGCELAWDKPRTCNVVDMDSSRSSICEPESHLIYCQSRQALFRP